jgi:hypothetical protein
MCRPPYVDAGSKFVCSMTPTNGKPGSLTLSQYVSDKLRSSSSTMQTFARYSTRLSDSIHGAGACGATRSATIGSAGVAMTAAASMVPSSVSTPCT